jgi:hypothetical protein
MHEILHFVQNHKRGIFIITTQSLEEEGRIQARAAVEGTRIALKPFLKAMSSDPLEQPLTRFQYLCVQLHDFVMIFVLFRMHDVTLITAKKSRRFRLDIAARGNPLKVP